MITNEIKQEHDRQILNKTDSNKLKYVLIGNVNNNLILCDYPSSISLNVKFIFNLRFLKMGELYLKK